MCTKTSGRIFISIFLLILFFSIVLTPSFPKTSQVADAKSNPYPEGQCTWWAWEKRQDLPTNLHDALTWADSVRKDFPTGSIPIVGAIVVFQPWTQGALENGHVAYVEEVYSSTSFRVSEMHFPTLGVVTSRNCTTGTGVEFIYFKVKAAKLKLSSVKANPKTFNPGNGEITTISYKITGGVPPYGIAFQVPGVRTISSTQQSEGVGSLVWDGKDDGGNIVPEGKYSFIVSVTGSGETSCKTKKGSVKVKGSSTQYEARVKVSASVQWVNTGLRVNVGDQITITASGSWTPGPPESGKVGPDGSSILWGDNFLNIYDIGCGPYSAITSVPHWAALIGYIGEAPPPSGSYTSTGIIAEAKKIFVVGSNFNGKATLSGTLWLNFNDDTYSNYTIDNKGEVTAVVKVSSSK